MKFDTPFIAIFYEDDVRVPGFLRITSEDETSYYVYDYLTEEVYPVDREALDYHEDDVWPVLSIVDTATLCGVPF